MRKIIAFILVFVMAWGSSALAAAPSSSQDALDANSKRAFVTELAKSKMWGQARSQLARNGFQPDLDSVRLTQGMKDGVAYEAAMIALTAKEDSHGTNWLYVVHVSTSWTYVLVQATQGDDGVITMTTTDLLTLKYVGAKVKGNEILEATKNGAATQLPQRGSNDSGATTQSVCSWVCDITTVVAATWVCLDAGPWSGICGLVLWAFSVLTCWLYCSFDPNASTQPSAVAGRTTEKFMPQTAGTGFPSSSIVQYS